MKRELFLFLSFGVAIALYAQFPYGTTGLLHMPTGNMQRDKTFMAGSSYLDKEATPNHWSYYTFNYYVNITIFPFLEVGYTCTLNKALKGNTYFPEFVWGKYRNQDRQFSVRLRLLKENQFWKYMPSVVIGGNDVLTRDWQGTSERNEGSGLNSPTTLGNGHWNRYYIAMTRHFEWYGTFGIHVAYVYNRRIDYHLNGPAIGVDYKPSFHAFLRLMAEYDSRTINLGVGYSIWKEHINLVAELSDFRYVSAGVVFKVYLK